MFSNFYTYLYFAAFFLSGSLSILIRVLKGRNRNKVLDAVSPVIFFLLIVTVLLVLAGLLAVNEYPPKVLSPLIFFISLSVFFILPAYFLRKIMIPVVLALSAFFFWIIPHVLDGYIPMETDDPVSLTVLNHTDEIITLEVDSSRGVEFYSLDKENLASEPATFIEFPDFLFFLVSRSYLALPIEMTQQQQNHIPLVLKPFASIELIELPPFNDHIFSSILLTCKTDGSIHITVRD